VSRNPRTYTPAQVMQRAMRWNFVAAGVVGIAGAVVGGLVAGWIGAVSGLIGGAIVEALTAITATSVSIAARRVTGPEHAAVFVGLVAGGWFLKLVVFVALAITLSGRSWIQPTALFLTVIAAIVVTLVIEVVIVARSRVLYVPDVG
jgi:drug/metabolite transporter (DMT)-like permease